MDDVRLRHAMDTYRQHAVYRGSAIALAGFAVLLLWVVTSLASYPAIAERFSLLPHPGILPFVVAAACFLPLAWRNDYPVAVLIATAVLTGVYLSLPWPPAIVILAPMIALFTVAERYGGRRTVPVGIAIGVVVLGVSALTVSVSYTVAQAVALLALLGLSAALGHSTQTRRELFEEIQRKRAEEMRRHEEEDLRRIEEERLRIARDVHDIMAHSLTLMTLQADAGLAGAQDSEKVTAAFTVIGDTGRATLRDLRSMLSVLAGDTDEASPREPVASLAQLEQLITSVRETGLEVTLDAKPAAELAELPGAISVSAYRIVQEALTNVVRHANAKHVTVSVDAGGNDLTLAVVDDGDGGKMDTSGSGRGLLGMAERVEVLGGTISVGPATEGGFAVRATIPLARS